MQHGNGHIGRNGANGALKNGVPETTVEGGPCVDVYYSDNRGQRCGYFQLSQPVIKTHAPYVGEITVYAGDDNEKLGECLPEDAGYPEWEKKHRQWKEICKEVGKIQFSRDIRHCSVKIKDNHECTDKWLRHGDMQQTLDVAAPTCEHVCSKNTDINVVARIARTLCEYRAEGKAGIACELMQCQPPTGHRHATHSGGVQEREAQTVSDWFG